MVIATSRWQRVEDVNLIEHKFQMETHSFIRNSCRQPLQFSLRQISESLLWSKLLDIYVAVEIYDCRQWSGLLQDFHEPLSTLIFLGLLHHSNFFLLLGQVGERFLHSTTAWETISSAKWPGSPLTMASQLHHFCTNLHRGLKNFLGFLSASNNPQHVLQGFSCRSGTSDFGSRSLEQLVFIYNMQHM